MTDMMDGIRILEVAEHTFVPLAAGILADWGADVIKIEHPERGDAMRGLAASGGINVGGGGVHVLMEHANRGSAAWVSTSRAPRASKFSTDWLNRRTCS